MSRCILLVSILIGLSAGTVSAQSHYLGLTEEYDTLLYNENLRVLVPPEQVPTRLDWRDHGFVTSIKDQSSCGSCWAFTAAACLESHILIEGSRILFDLSEQYIVSCDNTNWGCSGGNIHVFEWMKTHPAVREIDFPYTATDAPCNSPYPVISENFTHWYTLTPENTTQFKAALSAGPLFTGFAVYQDFVDYWNKTTPYPNNVYYHSSGALLGYHAVLLIGYDDSLEGGCWICKNSWGNTGPTGDGIFKVKYDSGCKFNFVGASMDFDEEQTKYFVILIDRTGSMSALRASGETRFQAAINWALGDVQTIFTLQPDSKIAVMYFDTGGIFVELGFADSWNLVREAILDVPGPGGATPLGEAMCAAADMLLNSPHAGEGELYIYTDGDENSSSTDPVSLVCDVCDGYSYGGWNSECDPSDNNPPCTDMQICISQQLINNNVNYVRYFGDPIRFSSIRGDGRDSDGAPALPSDKDPDPETIRAHAFSDVTFLQFLSNQSGGELVYVSDSPSAVELSSFDAFTRGGYVEISWCTLAEINSVGFNVQRSTSEDGLFRTINGEVIPAAGSATEGASYLFTDEDVSAGSDYYYRLEELVTHGEKIVYGPVLAVGGAEPPIPVTFGLAQNYPNPFNPATEISYTLPVDCHVKLEIYNVLGQRIASLVDEPQSAGDKILRWDGRDDKGLRVSSGIYFCRLEAGTFTEIKKMVLTR